MKWYQRVLTTFVFWSHALWTQIARRGKPRLVKLPVPEELLPLFEVGSIIMAYCNFAQVRPEKLAISGHLQEIVNGQVSEETLSFIQKTLTNQDLVGLTFNWMVTLGDARAEELGPFRVHLTLDRK